ncbi:MAG: hypothetical protein QOE97_2375 [Pseudonocardiales bacterium]|jgi:hypothetical protein|nr:hypothetical protein [Pseudonocardiales bacterium]
MLHPVGSLPPSVYWRRRLALLGSLIVLIALTGYVLRPGGGSSPTGAGSSLQQTTSSPSTSAPAPTPTTASTSTSTSASSTSTHGSTATSVAPARCALSGLKLAAMVQKPAYQVGDQPVVMLQVTNSTTVPCVQDLSDTQIELRVYNGESRVWGSHDCQIQPGTADRTLMAGQAVRVSVVWSGLSSQPKCAGTRQRVGAGTYTLYALLAGKEGTAAQFTMG